MKIHTQLLRFNTDLHTAVGLFMCLRNKHRKPLLLESNDYHSRSDSASIIGFDPLVEIEVLPTQILVKTGVETTVQPIADPGRISEQLEALMGKYTPVKNHANNGFFSYFSFEFSHFEETTVSVTESELGVPLATFILYKYLIHFDHFHDTGELIYNSFDGSELSSEEIEELLQSKHASELPFSLTTDETSSLSDADFLQLVSDAKQHIYRGDVFQLVVSRPFQQPFFGDDFQIYRELRRLNPSPYLFYADLEHFRIMGSSPETQIQLKNDIAEIHPIAGTVRKTGSAEIDAEAVKELISDDKENAEHTMLVDLARNDLSKYCENVKVVRYKEVQHFSHVIHLVSKVIGKLNDASPYQLFNGTFPAGTLSGTPKPKALELIQKYEPGTRDYYGGAIGFIGFNGSMNLAIVIRSILSKNNRLNYRAGAGVVYDSIPQNELQEVNNKLGAVRRAIQSAATKHA